ncbi:hypothetical protein ACFFRR_004957 [Megaselia abdita]
MFIKADGVFYPAYLNEEFFTESLENGFNESKISVQGITFEMGSTPGENYCSQIFRVRVTYKRKKSDKFYETSLIIKSLLVGDQMDFLEQIDSFSKERTMYMKLLPIMEVILNGEKLAPKCFYTQKNPTGIYVFEDLRALGYKLSNRQIGLDLPHCEIAMRKIARFHASSMILVKKVPSIFDGFKQGLLSEDSIFENASLVKMFGGHLKMLANVVNKFQGYENIGTKLEKYHSNIVQNLLKCGSQRPGELAVLNHGDFWVNNIMFNYNEAGEPIDCVFVDMQMNVYSSPGMDLNYFFNTSLPLDILINNREYLIQIYYDSLKETLETHHYEDVPCYELVRKEVATREDHGFFASYAIFPNVIMDRCESQDMSCESLQDEELGQMKREVIFAGERLRDHMKYSLKRFDDLGVFE